MRRTASRYMMRKHIEPTPRPRARFGVALPLRSHSSDRPLPDGLPTPSTNDPDTVVRTLTWPPGSVPQAPA